MYCRWKGVQQAMMRFLGLVTCLLSLSCGHTSSARKERLAAEQRERIVRDETDSWSKRAVALSRFAPDGEVRAAIGVPEKREYVYCPGSRAERLDSIANTKSRGRLLLLQGTTGSMAAGHELIRDAERREDGILAEPVNPEYERLQCERWLYAGAETNLILVMVFDAEKNKGVLGSWSVHRAERN
jgi:hypothetical protein